MIVSLAWHELRQQVGGRVFWIVFAVSVLMVAGGMVIDELRVGLEGEARTGASAIVRTHLVWTLFFLFTAAAFVGEAMLRDEASRFADLVRATPVGRAHYALGRFAGAFGAVLLCFASVPFAMAGAGTALGLGSGSALAYLFAGVALALPNLLLASALFFALARLTRSMTGCLLGAAALLTLYGAAGKAGGAMPAILEPFGFAASAGLGLEADLGWQGTGVLPANRLLWLFVAAVLIAFGTWLSTRDPRQAGRTTPIKTEHRASALPETEVLRALPHARGGQSVDVAQLLVRTIFEVRRAALTPAFAALLVMGLAAAASAAAHVTGTRPTIVALTTSFQLVPVVVVLFFTGELFWAEREHNVAPILAAAPANEAVLVHAKLLAIALMLLSLAVASAAAGIAVELVRGAEPSPGSYLLWYVLPRFYDWLLLAALALMLQSLAPNKLAGWGYMVLFLIGSLALNKLGWQDPHYRYGAYPGAPLPPAITGVQGAGWYRLGWGMIAAAMVALACRRGLPLRSHGVARAPSQAAR